MVLLNQRMCFHFVIEADFISIDLISKQISACVFIFLFKEEQWDRFHFYKFHK